MAEANSTRDRLGTLLRATRAWRLETDVQRLMKRVAAETPELLGFQRGSVFLLENGKLAERARWPEAGVETSIRASALQLAQQVVRTGRPQQLPAVDATGADAACVPLTGSRGIVGALYIDAPPRRQLLAQDAHRFLDLVGLQAASALESIVSYYVSTTDALSGLSTHRHFQQQVEQSVRRAERLERAVSLVLLELDHFSELADAIGREAANRGLVMVADLLRSNLRTTDAIARFGADEFEFLLPDTDGATAFNVAEKIRRQISALTLPQHRSLKATTGIASYPANAIDAQALFLQADAALYEAKELGRDRTICSAAEPSERRKPPESEYTAIKAAHALAPILSFTPSQGAIVEGQGVVFGASGTPLKAEDWGTVCGKYELRDGEWVAAAPGENILMWNTPVVGPFRFVCEVWHETGGEASLIGQGPPPNVIWTWDKRSQYDGFCFQFGADYNICTKLARNGVDVWAQYGLSVEPRRKYLVEMEWVDGWLYCSIDGKRVLEYRELYPLRGSHIGFYAYEFGAHFRPIEVHWRGGGLLVPAMQTADDLYESGEFQKAIERYHDIATRFPERHEGIEAALKMGTCLAGLKDFAEAHRTFESLKGTVLEPFALAEDARAYLDDPNEDPRRCIEIFRNAITRFPGQIRTALIGLIIERRNRLRAEPLPFEQELEVRLELARIARDSSETVLQSQISCAHVALLQALQLGRHESALTEILAFEKRLLPAQRDRLLEQYTRLVVVLSAGRDDLLPEPPHHSLAAIGPPLGTWSTGLALHVIVRKDKAAAFANTVPDPFPAHLDKGIYGHTLALVHFSREKPREAIDVIKSWIQPLLQPKARRPGLLFRWTLGALVESQDPAAKEFFEPFIEQSAAAIEETNSQWVPPFARGRWALELGDFEEAARHTAWVPEVTDRQFVSPLLLHIFLHSLGLHKSHSSDDLHHMLSYLAAGAEFHLGSIMLGRAEPTISDAWPHPLWRPELRLWLGLWLEAKGQKQAALDIVKPSRDPRYGLTHSQPAIEKLLKRLQPGG